MLAASAAQTARMASSSPNPLGTAGLGLRAFIAIILDFEDPAYHEVTKYDRRTKIAEFRLKIDHAVFKKASSPEQRRLIIKALLRSITQMPETDW